jgi:hypothetical protein
VEWGLIEPESLIVEGLTDNDPVRMHATGFIHMRFFVERLEYLVGVTTDMRFASRHVAEEIGRIWSGQSQLPDLSKAATGKILKHLKTYIQQEYERRCKRHAFYEEFGLGGRVLVSALERAWVHFHSDRSPIDARR